MINIKWNFIQKGVRGILICTLFFLSACGEDPRDSAPGTSTSTEVVVIPPPPDTTPPTITASFSPLLNAAGWGKEDVTVTFTCSDANSGIAVCPPPVLVTTEGDGQVIAGTSTDLAGNSTSTS